MKTLRIIGVALLMVLLNVGFSSCSKSDDDNSESDTSASIEGKWYLKSEIWYGWKNGQPDMSNAKYSKTYNDYANERIWVIKKSGDAISLTENGTERSVSKVGNNEYRKNNDRFIVKTLTSNSLVVDYYDNYYKDKEEQKEFGVYTFMK
jgi:hypothetical protein